MHWLKKGKLRSWIRHTETYPYHLNLSSVVFFSACLLLAISSLLPAASTEATWDQIQADASKTVPLVIPANAWDFFHPTWQKSPLLNVFGVEKSNFQTLVESPVNTRAFVTDPGGRIEKEFQVPESLKNSVSFWVDVYARYSSNIRIVHDRQDMNIVYGYIDFRPFYRTMSRVAAEAKANQVEKQILKSLKARLLEAASVAQTKTFPLEEREAIKAFLSSKGIGSKEAILSHISLIRTQSGQSDMFLQALYRSKNLLPHIEAVFKQQGLPVALARIPFVESSFNARALSKIGALGIWQFTKETAKEMMSSHTEAEWADPLKQTRSAARLLKMYKNVLPDWGTVITSYNSGVGRLRKVVEKYRFTKMEQIYTLPPDKDSLGFAGRNFYPEFLAANIVEAYKEEIFSHLLTPNDYSIVFRGKGVFATDSCEM